MSRPGGALEAVGKGLAVGMFWLLFLLAMDVGFRVIVSIVWALGDDERPAVVDQRGASEPYRDVAFDAEAFFTELRAARKEAYTPYVVWRSRPYDGEFIDIDAEGNRSTFNGSEAADALEVWLFGGSVVWGLGAPDAETVSSHLAEALNGGLGVPARVRNLGEIGFVNTQEIVLLLRELQRGRRPDLVVFLDGANDGPAAVLWPEFDGNHMNFTNIRDRFEEREPKELSPVLRILKRSGTWRMADLLRKKLGVQGARQQAPPYVVPSDPAEAARRGRRAAQVWLDNRRYVDALGAHYGFTPFYLLQPSLKVGAKQRHPSEEALLESEMENDAKRVGMESFAAMREGVREHLAAHADEGRRTVDLSDLYADVAQPLYFDYVHVGPAGNRLIARAMADVLRRYACDAPHDGVPAPVPAGLAHSCD